MSVTKENRRFTRLPLEIPFRIQLPDGTVHKYRQFEDISLGGCQVNSKKEFEMYSDCSIEILLDDTAEDSCTSIEVQAKIMRIGYEFTGIKFIRLSQNNLEKLQDLLKFNAPDPEKISSEIVEHIGII